MSSNPPKQSRWSRMGNAMKRTPSMLVPSNASIKSTSSSSPPPATPPPTTFPSAKKNSSDRDSDTASISTSKEKKGSIRSRMGKVMKRTSSLLTPATPRTSDSIDSMDTKIDVSPEVLSPPPTVSTAPLVSPIAESPVIVQPAFTSFSSPPTEQAQAVTVSGTSDDLLLPPTDVLASVPATSIVTDEPEAMSESDLSPPVQAAVIAPETEKVQEPEIEKVQQVDPEDIPDAPQMQIERSNSTSSYEVVSAPQEEEVQSSSQEEVTHHVDVQSEPQGEISPAASKEEEAKPYALEEEEKEQNELALTAEKVEPTTVIEEVPVSTAVEEPTQSQLASHDEQNILLPTGTETPSSFEPPSTSSPHQPPALTDFELDLAEALADESELLPSINGSASHEPVSKAPLESEKPKLEILHPLSPVFPSHSHPLSISTANSTTTVTVAAVETDPLLPSTQANGSAAYPPGTTKLASAEGPNSNGSNKLSPTQAEKPLIDRFIEWLWSWIPWDAVIV